MMINEKRGRILDARTLFMLIQKNKYLKRIAEILKLHVLHHAVNRADRSVTSIFTNMYKKRIFAL